MQPYVSREVDDADASCVVANVESGDHSSHEIPRMVEIVRAYAAGGVNNEHHVHAASAAWHDIFHVLQEFTRVARFFVV